MSLTVEQLTRPRYKVIADYPGSSDKIGKIYTFNSADNPFLSSSESFVDYFAQYPAIFQKLQWWEERDVEALPEYVKIVSNDFKKLLGTVGRAEHMKGGVLIHYSGGGTYTHWIDTEPATLAEYESFNAAKQC